MTAADLHRELVRRGVVLWVEDGRLRYRGARDALTPDLLDAMRRHRDALVALVGAEGTEGPLSEGQRGLWFLCQDDPGSVAYNIGFACRIVSGVDAGLLEGAVRGLVARHPALRTVFAVRDGAPEQRVLPSVAITLERTPGAGASVPLASGAGASMIAVSGPSDAAVPVTAASAPSASEAGVAAAVDEAIRRPFDLERGPLVRAHLFEAPEGPVFLLTLHHLVHDGWSLWLLLDELRELYAAAREGRPAALPPVGTTYRDFVAREAAALGSEDARRSLAYWRHRLAGPLPVLALPADRPRPPVRSDRGAAVPFVLDTALTAALRRRAQAEGATLYTLLLAAFQVLLARLGGQDEVVVGSPVAGRDDPALAGLVGYCINQVALRADLREDPPFDAFLGEVRRRVLEAVEHQGYPFPRLVEDLAPAREAGRSPLFQATFALQKPQRFEEVADLFVAAEMGVVVEPGRRVGWGSLTLAPYPLRQRRAWFDLTVQLMEVREVLAGSLTYSADLFDEPTAARMARGFETLLRAVVATPGLPVSRLPLLDAAETRRVRGVVPAEISVTASLPELFLAQAARRPDAVAVVADGASLTYGALAAWSDRLARRLRAAGVGPEVIAGVALDRSPELVAAILGVLRAGGAYLPLDPDLPRERLAFMVKDAGARVVVTSRALADRVDGPVLLVDDEEDAALAVALPPPAPGNLAYVIYTSGSTGRPKGVLVTHAAVVRLFPAAAPWAPVAEDDVWTLFHSASFDFSVWELGGALLHGGRLVIVPRAVSRAPEDFVALLAREAVTVLSQTPTAFDGVARVAGRPGSDPLALRLVVFGGEALDPQRLDGWFGRHGDRTPRLVNMYGITETTVHVTARPVLAADAARRGSRIGRPLADLRTHLVDRHLALVPEGVAGEICIGGAGVARGYLGRPALTAERFRPDPFADLPGARLYRSGDLARLAGDDDLEYLGRIDQQVKVRGHRIEPGEIEAALGEHEAVAAACVTARRDETGAVTLAAHVVPDPTLAGPVARGAALLRRRPETAGWLTELPNGLTVAHLNRAETAFVYEEIFGRRAYLQHGVALADGDCVVDVGANIGLFPLFLRHAGLRARVVALEPVPAAFERLAVNAELYGLDVAALPCALGPEPGEARFTWYPAASVLSGRYPDAARAVALARRSLLQRHGERDLGGVDDAALTALLTERLEAREITCPVRTLSGVIAELDLGRIDLLKIDVERAELDVLAGIAPGDWARIRQVVVEVHDEDGRLAAVERLLARHGFHTVVAQDEALTGTEIVSVYATRVGTPPSTPPSSPSRSSDGSSAMASAPPPPAPEPAASARSPLPAAAAPPSTPSPAIGWASATRLAAELRRHARERLPDYMVPATFAFLDALPMTANGKLDRAALPATAVPAGAPAGVAPRTAAERTLAAIWSQVLGRPDVGVTENFFELGGDSILSITVASRAQAAGLPVRSRQLFQHQTVAELAAALESAEPPPLAAAEAAGPAPLTPIQRWFFELGLARPDQVVQSARLVLPPGTGPAAVAAALRAVVARHDALRLAFAGPGAADLQAPVTGDLDVPLVVVDGGADLPDLGATLDLRHPPLVRAAFIPGTPPHLVLVVHHLGVDAVSWRILEEDLRDALAGAALRPATTPFATWARRLARFARTAALDEDAAYWLRRVPEVPAVPLDVPCPPGANLEGDADTVAVSLDAAGSRALLRDASAARRSPPHELLLAALLEAWTEWTGHDVMLVDVEGHGREELFPDVDLSRTVGWFTTMFPVVLGGAGSGPGIARRVEAVREQLRAVPRRGLGHGLLRYLGDDAVRARLRDRPAPPIVFNYLGRLDGDLATLGPGPDGAGTGVPASAPENRRAHLLDLTAFVTDERLHLCWTYAARAHRRETISRLAEAHLAALGTLGEAALDPAAPAPADFPLADLDAGKLRRLSRLLGERGGSR